jgi:hypothetical protein
MMELSADGLGAGWATLRTGASNLVLKLFDSMCRPTTAKQDRAHREDQQVAAGGAEINYRSGKGAAKNRSTEKTACPPDRVVALAPASAFAQAKSPNDGGQVNVPAGAKFDGGSKPAASTFYGRNANDGGTGPAVAQVSTAAAKPSKKSASAPAPVHLGRAVNDGGSV